MRDISQVLLDIRDVGENILSTGKDIQLLLREAKQDQIRHSQDLVENILSLCAYLSGLHIEDLDRWEELEDEGRKVEFSCVSLRSALKDAANFQSKAKEVFNLLRIVEVSSNRIITLSFVSEAKSSKSCNEEDVCYSNKVSCEQSCDGVCYEDAPSGQTSATPGDDVVPRTTATFSETLGDEEVCYRDKVSCEEDCRGECYLDSADSSYVSSSGGSSNGGKESISEDNINDAEFCRVDGVCDQVTDRCPEYNEYFTESPFTHVESGVFADFEASEQPQVGEYNSSKKLPRDMSEIGEEDLDLSSAIRESMMNVDASYEETDLIDNDHGNLFDLENTNALNYDESLKDMEMTNIEYQSADGTVIHEFEVNNAVSTDDSRGGDEVVHSDPKSTSTENAVNEDCVITHDHVDTDTTAHSYTYNSDETTTSGYETTTESSYYSYNTEDSTTTGYDTTTETYATEEPTTPAYETTTQDLYKLSQDVYSLANDLSSKANEISSLSSDISSKVSSMGSMVSDLNTYDNDELTKTINSVNKLTQEISSKTSEMSSGCSSMSSLASDISSASSDLSSSERHHPIRTTPWQKISYKGQELVTAAQSVVSAAQDILARVGGVVELAKGLSVADAVEAAAYEVTAKAQLAISETLGVASAVLELMTSLES